MTEYDVHKMYEEQQSKDQVTALHADKGVLEVRYADGTMEIFKKRKLLKGFKLIKKRGVLGKMVVIYQPLDKILTILKKQGLLENEQKN